MSLSLISFQMMRVISSPSSSTTVPVTLIFCIEGPRSKGRGLARSCGTISAAVAPQQDEPKATRSRLSARPIEHRNATRKDRPRAARASAAASAARRRGRPCLPRADDRLRGSQELAIAGLDRATLEPVLTYCAEERCVADRRDLPGCKRRTEAEGITSFDRLHRPPSRDRRRRRRGAPRRRRASETLHVDSLEALAKTWSGENYWFWARRVLRKLRHGIRRAHMQGDAVRRRGRDAGRHPDGAAARRQHRHGGARHGQFRPRRPAPRRPARRLAEREGAHRRLGRQLRHRRCRGLSDARRERSAISTGSAATTARQRDLRKPVLTPERGGGGDARADRAGRALRRAVRARAQRPGDRARSPTPTRSS